MTAAVSLQCTHHLLRQTLAMALHRHRSHRTGWLRAGVLGANDGILSISSLMLGVAAAHATHAGIFTAGFAGLVAGALSMGAGEHVSVSSQADTERADLELEQHALLHDYDSERRELQDIYIQRGLSPELAERVAWQLMSFDALGTHAREDVGITDTLAARPLQAAVTSAVSFFAGGSVPLAVGSFVPSRVLAPSIAIVSLVFLCGLGAVAARAGGASATRGALRVLFWGIVVMGLTHMLGMRFA